MDRDLYYEEEELLCFGKNITNIYRKNEPFIYDFKDTEGNNHTLEFSFNKIDHYRHSVKKKNKIISPFTSVHFNRLRTPDSDFGVELREFGVGSRKRS